MRQFLLVYQRSTGELLLAEDLGDDRTEAMRRRAERERREKDDPDVEVVVLSGADAEAIKRTHARYFKSVREIAEDWQKRLSMI